MIEVDADNLNQQVRKMKYALISGIMLFSILLVISIGAFADNTIASKDMINTTKSLNLTNTASNASTSSLKTSTLSTNMKDLKSLVISVNLTKLKSPIKSVKTNNNRTSTLSTRYGKTEKLSHICESKQTKITET